MASSVRLADGAFDASYGVDSSRIISVQSQTTPQGIPRNGLAWLDNATVRGGGITQRNGWLQLLMVIAKDNGLYQGGFLYAPLFSNPYLILQINGRIYKALVESPFSVTDLSAEFGLTNPPTPQVFMEQGEQFLIIQAGDNTNPVPTLPLFWDGTTLRRSNGIQPNTSGSVPTTYNLTTTAPWTIPTVNSTVVVTLNAPYPGSLNDQGQWITPTTGIIGGVFQVTVIAGNTITLKTLSSPYVGGTYPPGNYQFSTSVTTTGTTSELPAATCMVYYAGRLWYAQGRIYTAGDIVGGPSGTLAYKFTDSILKVTENPLAIGGDGFSVPGQSGDITALFYTANLNTQLGQGPLYISTRKSIYSLNVPVTRTDWIGANNNNQPVQTVAQIKYGAVGDRCVTHVNGDAWYQSLEPAIRSLNVSIKYFQQWGNVQLSNNERRVLNFNDRSIMKTATGIEFDNRLWQAILPTQTPVGVAFKGVAPLDFDLISTLQEKQPPAWEGMLEGLNILQLFEGDFGGLSRAFALVWSDPGVGGDGGIWVWEITNFARFDKVDGGDGNRVNWYWEDPAWTFEKEFEMKQLDGGELWIDRIVGTVDLEVEYRPDANPCWQPWFQTSFCAARSTCESVANPVCYPEGQFCEGAKFPVTFPRPPLPVCSQMDKRPVDRGYRFQVRVKVRGFCRIVGRLYFALPIERKPFDGIVC